VEDPTADRACIGRSRPSGVYPDATSDKRRTANGATPPLSSADGGGVERVTLQVGDLPRTSGLLGLLVGTLQRQLVAVSGTSALTCGYALTGIDR
jgi:hypothetical protein